jgi:Trypsin-like peptidase domain
MSDTQLVRDVVLPLVRLRPGGDGIAMTRFCGSAFLIGDRGAALTAAHLLPMRQLADEPLALLRVVNGEWTAFNVVSWEIHPTEDVAVLKLPVEIGPSWLQLAGTWHGQTAPYRQFGYPTDVQLEVVQRGEARPRPDLVYSQGYIRRRITGTPLPGIRGDAFFELSEVAGSGSSGSPVMLMAPGSAWMVIGVYLGQRITTGEDSISVGYAVREEAFRDWKPELLGRTVIRESRVATSGSDSKGKSAGD